MKTAQWTKLDVGHGGDSGIQSTSTITTQHFVITGEM